MVHSPRDLIPALSALLFASERPLSAQELGELMGRVDSDAPSVDTIEGTVEVLAETLRSFGAGFEVVRVAGGWELRTRADLAGYVSELRRRRPQKLSRASMEALAIIAYRQPCTRADVEAIRGVDSSSVLRSLLDRSLIRSLGTSDEVGRPIVYGTTATFLELFGLATLTQLPPLRDVSELTDEFRGELDRFDAIETAAEDPQESHE